MAQRRAEGGLPWTVESFDRWHAEQPKRWEFIAGVPVMMAPGSLLPAVIKGDAFRHLSNKLAGSPCRAFVDGGEVKSHQLAAIPDVVVACRPLDLSCPALAEPVAIVQVLSPSSERDDIGRKWQGYCLTPSLKHYVVVAQDSRFVTAHTRTGAAAFDEGVHQEGEIRLDGVGATLSLNEIYEGVSFEAPGDDG